MEKFEIIPARPEDACYIADAILMAIGEELTLSLAGEDHSRNDVRELFRSLAQRNDSQYSYLNSLIAINEHGEVAGVIVCYDGAELHRLRKVFFEQAAEKIGLVLDRVPDDETDGNEFYLDSLAVFPSFRGKGLARKLIKEALIKASKHGKPLGLLCSNHNPGARRLYDSLGFVYSGDRPFAGEMMNHLILKDIH